jgi:transposase-like protein
MALTDNEREKKIKRTKKKFKYELGNTRYSDKQKIEAIHSYLAIGNLALTSRIIDIPEITLRKWKAQEWWATLVEEIKMQERIELSARMKKLIEASQGVVAQRLETGDPILNQKTGEIVYKPVSMKDAHKVATDLIDRRTIVEKAALSNEVVEKNDDDKLEKLAEKFAEMATRSIEKKFEKRRTVDIADVEFALKENNNAVYEEGEREEREGLQEGERTLQLSSGTNQETFGEDDSETSV